MATGAGQAAALADEAVGVARTIARAGGHPGRVGRRAGPRRGELGSRTYAVDPVDVPLADKVGLLADWSGRLLASGTVDHVTADVLAVTEDKYYADLLGTEATQRRVRVHPTVEAIAVDPEGGFETMRTVAPPVGRGWEYLDGDGWDWDAELDALPDLLAEKVRAPSIVAGTYDLVVDPTNLWLTIHESIGHATELDRAMGYEAAYAGTSFATFDQLGIAALRVRGRCTSPGTAPPPTGWPPWPSTTRGCRASPSTSSGRASSPATSWTGPSPPPPASGRPTAAPSPTPRCTCPSSGWPTSPSSRPTATGPTTEELIGGVDRGLYIVGDKSWSIDMQRYNFQFTGQRFFRIEGGRLVGQVRDVAYQATTTEFWGSMEAVGGRSTYLLGGAFNCGKGQPGQVAPVSHGCPSVLVRGVRVLNARE